jgi:hypothetical protein
MLSGDGRIRMLRPPTGEGEAPFGSSSCTWRDLGIVPEKWAFQAGGADCICHYAWAATTHRGATVVGTEGRKTVGRCPPLFDRIPGLIWTISPCEAACARWVALVNEKLQPLAAQEVRDPADDKDLQEVSRPMGPFSSRPLLFTMDTPLASDQKIVMLDAKCVGTSEINGR